MTRNARMPVPGIEIFLLVLAATHLNAQRSGPAAPVDPASAERGRGLYASNCAFCHGSQGMGTEQAPALVRNFLVSQDRNGEMIGPVIKAGRPTLGMPAFASLQPGEISDL